MSEKKNGINTKMLKSWILLLNKIQKTLNTQLSFIQLTIINQALKTKGKQKHAATLYFKLLFFD